MTDRLSRRSFLTRSAIIGCSAAASPLFSPVTFAAAPWDTRLVVIILRGGMDALDVVLPYGDPDYAPSRGMLAHNTITGSTDLDGFFALTGGLAPLLPLWSRGDLGFVHAVSTPYRNKRSHFDGQDLLESGTATLGQSRDGWLNRMLGQIPGTQATTAYAIGDGRLQVLSGPAPYSNWSPDARLTLSPQAIRLTEMVMEDDPAFHAAFSQALALSAEEGAEQAAMGGTGLASDDAAQMTTPRPAKGPAHLKIAKFAAERLRAHRPRRGHGRARRRGRRGPRLPELRRFAAARFAARVPRRLASLAQAIIGQQRCDGVQVPEIEVLAAPVSRLLIQAGPQMQRKHPATLVLVFRFRP